MQAKMRSLLRLLVKSIIGDRERQADATAAREAHHSASPAADPSAQNTQDTGTLWKPGRIHMLAHIRTLTGSREEQETRTKKQNSAFFFFSLTLWDAFTFFSHQKEAGNARKIHGGGSY